MAGQHAIGGAPQLMSSNGTRVGGANVSGNASSSSGNATADGGIDIDTEAYSPGVAVFLMYLLLVGVP